MKDLSEYKIRRDQLKVQRSDLLQRKETIGPCRQGDGPAWNRLQEIEAELRLVNTRLRANNTEEAVVLRQIAEERRAKGAAEAKENAERSFDEPKPGQPLEDLGEALLRIAVKLNRAVQRLRHPLPFTVEFKKALDVYIKAQRAHLSELKEDLGLDDSTVDLRAVVVPKAMIDALANEDNEEDFSKVWEEGE